MYKSSNQKWENWKLSASLVVALPSALCLDYYNLFDKAST